MRRVDVLMLIQYAAERWPSFRLPETQEALDVRVLAWSDALGDLDVTAVRAAMVSLGGEFCPALDRLRVEALRLADPDAGMPSFGDAWAEVKQEISRVGSYGQPEWSHPAIANAVRAVGGWKTLCMMEIRDEGVWIGHWRRVYGDAVEHHQRDTTMPPSVASLVSGLAAALALPGGDDR